MTDRLFRNADLSDVLAGQEQTMANEVGSLSEARVLNTSPEILCDYFVEKYKVEPLVIDESGIQVDYGDTQIDVSRRVEYAVFGRSGPTHVTGTRITFFVPFTGDPELFKYRPSTFSLSHLQGVVRGNELEFVYDRTSQEAPNIGSEFKRELQSVQKHLSRIADQVEQFNSTIRTKASQQYRSAAGEAASGPRDHRRSGVSAQTPVRRACDLCFARGKATRRTPTSSGLNNALSAGTHPEYGGVRAHPVGHFEYGHGDGAQSERIQDNGGGRPSAALLGATEWTVRRAGHRRDFQLRGKDRYSDTSRGEEHFHR